MNREDRARAVFGGPVEPRVRLIFVSWGSAAWGRPTVAWGDVGGGGGPKARRCGRDPALLIA